MFFKERRKRQLKEETDRNNQDELDLYSKEHGLVMELFNEGCVAYNNGATLLDNPYIPYAPSVTLDELLARTAYMMHHDVIWRDGWLHRYATEHK